MLYVSLTLGDVSLYIRIFLCLGNSIRVCEKERLFLLLFWKMFIVPRDLIEITSLNYITHCAFLKTCALIYDSLTPSSPTITHSLTTESLRPSRFLASPSQQHPSRLQQRILLAARLMQPLRHSPPSPPYLSNARTTLIKLQSSYNIALGC